MQNLVEKAVDGSSRQIAEIGPLPRHDVKHLRKLAVTGNLGGVELPEKILDALAL